jgi:hypothetical protein
MERCMGFSTHLMLMANKQKKTLIETLKYLIILQFQISDLSNMDTDDIVIRRQMDLWHVANNLKELLITTQVCLEQFKIYLQACPLETQVASDDYAYSLAMDDSDIVNCKMGDVTWEKANTHIIESLKVVVDIAKKFDTVFPEPYIIYGDNRQSEVHDRIMTTKHFAFLKESFSSLTTIRENLHHFAAIFYVEKKKHPLLENIIFLETSISNQLNKYDQILISSEQQEISDSSSHKDDYDKFENDLATLLNMVLIVIQERYKNNLAPDAAPNDTNDHSNEHLNEEINDDEYERNKLKEKLIESIQVDIKALKIKEIYQILHRLLKNIFYTNSGPILNYCR